LFLY
jgi:hypothetical protein